MKRTIFILFCTLTLFTISCTGINESNKKTAQLQKIAFGSCGSEQHPLPIFNNIVEHNPDLFIFLGDNIYGDTENMDTLKAKYEKLGAKASYTNLQNNTEIIATWDDHDFGWNDAGKTYPFKEESKEIFLDFFNEPDSSSRRNHKGIYHSYEYDYDGHMLQIILLDTRTFRDDLIPYDGEFDNDNRYNYYHKEYATHKDPKATMLGEEQWIWLEEQLKKPADIRIIGSSTQFGIEWNGYEAWANFPHERKRMVQLIKDNKANGVLFISGDIHYSEISKYETDFYPLYDFTSSGLSKTWMFATPNKNRIEGPVMENHFGLISINWEKENITMETWDINNNQRIEYVVAIRDLQFENYK